MAKEEPGTMSRLNQHITRRQAIKVGGIAAIGLVFSAPLIQTLRPRSAFAGGNYRNAATAPGPTNGGDPTGPPSQSGPTGAGTEEGPSVFGVTF